jgi:DNA (cytosine-5)-methyltransferase 1
LRVVTHLKRTGYYTVFDLVNAANYGVPQTRERLLFIGSRDGEDVRMPDPTHSRNGTNGLARWVSLRDALNGLDQSEPAFTNMPPGWKRFVKHVPAGGNWRDLPKRLHEEALGSAFDSWGGRSGFFRRLAWNRPSPSLTTRPSSKATLLCHPTELRPLSVAEYARIQQFPDGWRFAGGVPQQYKQIGNAVPVALGHAIGLAIQKVMRSRGRKDKRGVVCLNATLIESLSKRPKTILNPPRMRKVKEAAAVDRWFNGRPRSRSELLGLLVPGTNGKPTSKQSQRVS